MYLGGKWEFFNLADGFRQVGTRPGIARAVHNPDLVQSRRHRRPTEPLLTVQLRQPLRIVAQPWGDMASRTPALTQPVSQRQYLSRGEGRGLRNGRTIWQKLGATNPNSVDHSVCYSKTWCGTPVDAFGKLFARKKGTKRVRDDGCSKPFVGHHWYSASTENQNRSIRKGVIRLGESSTAGAAADEDDIGMVLWGLSGHRGARLGCRKRLGDFELIRYIAGPDHIAERTACVHRDPVCHAIPSRAPGLSVTRGRSPSKPASGSPVAEQGAWPPLRPAAIRS